MILSGFSLCIPTFFPQGNVAVIMWVKWLGIKCRALASRRQHCGPITSTSDTGGWARIWSQNCLTLKHWPLPTRSLEREVFCFFFKCSPEDLLRGEGREGVGRETSIICLSHDWTCNSSMCPDQESDPQPLGVLDDAPTNWVIPAWARVGFEDDASECQAAYWEGHLLWLCPLLRRENWGWRKRAAVGTDPWLWWKEQEIELRRQALEEAVSYTHLTLPTRGSKCRSRWSPYH